nr:MAG TPA: hypothetical protein [Caudoviricetes sp.]
MIIGTHSRPLFYYILYVWLGLKALMFMISIKALRALMFRILHYNARV